MFIYIGVFIMNVPFKDPWTSSVCSTWGTLASFSDICCILPIYPLMFNMTYLSQFMFGKNYFCCFIVENLSLYLYPLLKFMMNTNHQFPL